MGTVMYCLWAVVIIISIVSHQTIGKRRKSSWMNDTPETECSDVDFGSCMGYEGNITGWIQWFKDKKLSGSTLLLGLHVFPLLTQGNCSQHTQRFLCAKYFPLCSHTKYRKKIGPCKALCDDVRNKCESKVNKAGFRWPKILRCDDLPLFETKDLCIGRSTEDDFQSMNDPPEFHADKVHDVTTGRQRKKSKGLSRFQQRLKSALSDIVASLTSLHDDL